MSYQCGAGCASSKSACKKESYEQFSASLQFGINVAILIAEAAMVVMSAGTAAPALLAANEGLVAAETAATAGRAGVASAEVAEAGAVAAKTAQAAEAGSAATKAGVATSNLGKAAQFGKTAAFQLVGGSLVQVGLTMSALTAAKQAFDQKLQNISDIPSTFTSDAVEGMVTSASEGTRMDWSKMDLTGTTAMVKAFKKPSCDDSGD